MRLNEKCVAEYSISSAPTDKEGYLNKKGELNRGYQRRWFILKGNLLYYFEKRSDKEPIGVIVLDNCHVELAESGEPYAFQITFGGDGRTYILGADSPKEMEAWMRSITHSNYECLRVMVESFESTLEKLTSEENDLASASSSGPDANPSRIGSFNRASNFITAGNKDEKQDANIPITERTFPEDVTNFVAANNDSLDNLLVPLSEEEDFAAAKGNVDNDVNFLETESAVGNLISFDDDSDDEQIPIQTEFPLDEGFYSIHKHTMDIMPLSYSDMGRLEDMHAESLVNRLSGNAPFRSRDDSALTLTVKREPVPRNLRPKSERRRNNIHTLYEYDAEAQRLDRGKSSTLPRPSSDHDIAGYNLEHSSIFRHLHELYSASIWVKCKEFGKKAMAPS